MKESQENETTNDESSYSEKKTEPFFSFRLRLASGRLGLDNSKLWVRGSNRGTDNNTKTNK